MRTLLDESLPPQRSEREMFSAPETEKRLARTFSQNTVLARRIDLSEVGLGETAMNTSSAGGEEPALERGWDELGAEEVPIAGVAGGSPNSDETQKAPPSA